MSVALELCSLQEQVAVLLDCSCAAACQQAVDVLIILQNSGFENAQLVQLLLYAALKLLQMLFDWFCELLCLAATQCTYS